MAASIDEHYGGVYRAVEAQKAGVSMDEIVKQANKVTFPPEEPIKDTEDSSFQKFYQGSVKEQVVEPADRLLSSILPGGTTFREAYGLDEDEDIFSWGAPEVGGSASKLAGRNPLMDIANIGLMGLQGVRTAMAALLVGGGLNVADATETLGKWAKDIENLADPQDQSVFKNMLINYPLGLAAGTLEAVPQILLTGILSKGARVNARDKILKANQDMLKKSIELGARQKIKKSNQGSKTKAKKLEDLDNKGVLNDLDDFTDFLASAVESVSPHIRNIGEMDAFYKTMAMEKANPNVYREVRKGREKFLQMASEPKIGRSYSRMTRAQKSQFETTLIRHEFVKKAEAIAEPWRNAHKMDRKLGDDSTFMEKTGMLRKTIWRHMDPMDVSKRTWQMGRMTEQVKQSQADGMIAFLEAKVFDGLYDYKTFRGRNMFTKLSAKMNKDGVALVKALNEGGRGALKGRKDLQGKYDMARGVLDRLADLEGLKKGQRVAEYFPHIREYMNGKNTNKSIDIGMADMVARNLFAVGGLENSKMKFAQHKLKFHKKRSSEAPGYKFDLREVFQARIQSGLQSAHFKSLWRNIHKEFDKIKDPTLKDYTKDYFKVLAGQRFEVNKVTDIKHAKQVDELARFLILNNYRGLLGLAADTAFKNLFQIQNSIGEIGYIPVGRGIASLLTKKGREVFRKSGEKPLDDVLKRQLEEDSTNYGQYEKIMKAYVDPILFLPMRGSEYINRGVVYLGAQLKFIDEGYHPDVASNMARKSVARTQFDYGRINTSPYMQTPLKKMAYQFGSYPVKEMLFLRSIAAELATPGKRLSGLAKSTRLIAFYGLLTKLGESTDTDVAQVAGLENMGTFGDTDIPVMLPTQYLDHITRMGAPSIKLGKDIGALAGKLDELMMGKMPEKEVKKVLGDLANMIPAKRYLYDKGWKNIMIYLPQGYRDRYGRRQKYGYWDAAKDAVGVLPKPVDTR